MIRRKFALALCLQLVTTALLASVGARGVEPEDGPAVDDIIEQERESDNEGGLAIASEGDNLTVTEAELEKGSRSNGGYLAGSPPHWLTGMWSQDVESEHDGRFAGLGIRLNNDTFLAHSDSCLAASKPGADQTARQKQRFDLNMPATLDTNRLGQPRFDPHQEIPSLLFACKKHEDLHGDFKIYKYARLADTDKQSARHWSSEALDANPLKEKPQFQHDAKVNTDCHLYSYSTLPQVEPVWRSGLRKFVRFPVKHNGCTNGICSFQSYTADHGVCPKLSDVGAPIMCGGSNKISHVVSKPLNDRWCRQQFSAYHLAPHHAAISKHIGKK